MAFVPRGMVSGMVLSGCEVLPDLGLRHSHEKVTMKGKHLWCPIV